MFSAWLDQIIDVIHALGNLARAIDWRFLEERFESVYTASLDIPLLPTPLMTGFAIIKHMHDF